MVQGGDNWCVLLGHSAHDGSAQAVGSVGVMSAPSQSKSAGVCWTGKGTLKPPTDVNFCFRTWKL